MNDYIVSLIRTWVPILVGGALTWVAANLGIVVDEQTQAGLLVAATGVVTGFYYALVRLAEKQWPAAGKLLGRSQPPNYSAS